jgi:hypothetical protein
MSGPSARNDGSQGVQTLRKTVTYLNNGTTITVGKLPANAIVSAAARSLRPRSTTPAPTR